MSEAKNQATTDASVDRVVMLPSDMGHCVGVLNVGIGDRICPMAKSCKRYLSHQQRQVGNYRGNRDAVYLFPSVNESGGCDHYWEST